MIPRPSFFINPTVSYYLIIGISRHSSHSSSQFDVFQIPTVLLCSPDCAGLCPRCGKKKAECVCPPEEEETAPADARLAILKSLLN